MCLPYQWRLRKAPSPVTYFRRAKHSKPGTLAKGHARVRGGLARHSRAALAISAIAGVSAFALVQASSGNSQPITVVSASDQRQYTADDTDRAVRAERAAARSVLRAASPAATTAAPKPKPKPTAATTPKPQPKPKPTVAAKPRLLAAPKPVPVKAPSWVIPMKGATVTSCFGQRWGVLHAGIDFALPSGTPIHAVGAGTVFSAGWAYSGYGISVVVDHGNGYLTHYAHMSQAKVSVGDTVKPGDILGLEGSTGDSTGPHLHFEVHKGMWNQINPAGWLADRGINVPC